MRSCYSVLGVTVEASEAELKSAYHRRLRQVHPDKAGKDSSDAALAEIQAAYRILSTSRAAYDRWLDEQGRRQAAGIVQATLSAAEFWDESGGFVECRCGGAFEAEESERELCPSGGVVYVACDGCSLHLRVQL